MSEHSKVYTQGKNLKDIWQGSYYEGLRKSFFKDQYHELCLGCKICANKVAESQKVKKMIRY